MEALGSPVSNERAKKGCKAVAGGFCPEDRDTETEIVAFVRYAVQVLVAMSQAVFWQATDII